MASTTVALDSSVSASVWIRIASVPEVVTTGDAAASTPVAATSSRSWSAVSWVTWSAGRVTRNSAPPVNSMPMSSFWTARPKTEMPMTTAEMAYQSQRRPTKSTETRPS